MTGTSTGERLHAKVRRVLKHDLRLVAHRKVAALLASGSGFVARPQLRFAGFHDQSVDFLIYERAVGSIGLVFVLDEQEAAAAEHLIDQAAFIRHLLVNEPDRDGRVAPAVEVVLACDAAERAKIGHTLRTLVAQTAFLDGLGINILPLHSKATAFAQRDVARAFPWLMRATRAWLQLARTDHRAALAGEEAAEVGPLSRLMIENFRLKGERRLDLAGETDVHIIHGQNGSGKSSLTEALEFSLTGSVERLRRSGDDADADLSAVVHRDLKDGGADRVDHARIVLSGLGRSASPDGPSEVLHEVTIGRSSGRPSQARFEPDGDPPLAPHLHPMSFRLDQTVMSRIAESSPLERAQFFLEAFFPHERPLVERYRQTKDAAEAAFAALPAAMQQAVEREHQRHLRDDRRASRAEIVGEQLSWAKQPEWPVGDKLFGSLLPGSAAMLQVLRPFDRDIEGFLDRTPAEATLAELKEALPPLDNVLAMLHHHRSVNLERLGRAREILLGLRAWTTSASQGGGDALANELNAWLEYRALAALCEKQYEIAASLHGASARMWQRDDSGGLFRLDVGVDLLDELRGQLEAWRRERDRRFARIRRNGRNERPSEHRSEPQKLVQLTPADSEVLDWAGRWLLPAGRGGARPLGRLVEAALDGNRPVSLPDDGLCPIGEAGWADPLLARLEDAIEAMKGLADLAPGEVAGLDRLRLTETACDAHAAERAAAKALEETLVSKISPGRGAAPDAEAVCLSRALNELIALFTPAHWAYDDVALHYRPGEGDLKLQVGPQEPNDGDGERSPPAQLRLNTAELNLLTLALFLLCAIRVANPIRLLILDDPLQNMDELTVTSVARGLARFMGLLNGHPGPPKTEAGTTEPDPARWMLLLLFHGEDDLARFRLEIPCAIYRLPWLTPDRVDEAAGRIAPVRSASCLRPEPLPLDAIVQRQPAPEAAGRSSHWRRTPRFEKGGM